MTDDRARGVTLTLLDLDGIVAHVRETKEIPADHDVEVGWAPWAYGRTADGTMIAVCQEGVGYRVNDIETLMLDIYVSRPGHMSIMPQFGLGLREDEVLALPTAGEVDLADHVRCFGARLESNFWTLHRTLGGAQ